MSRQSRQDRRRDEQRRREAERLRAIAARKRRKTIIASSITAAAVIILAVVGYFIFIVPSINAQSLTTIDRSNGTPVNEQVNPPVNNIRCDVGEQTTYHVHAHLTIYINDQPVQVPQGIGISTDNTCLYWLHTHDTTGVIHIEAPSQGTYTLGTFFKLWAEQFPQLQYPVQLDQTSGWQVYVNGKPYKGDFHNINLEAHTLITMGYNTTGFQPDTTFNWNGQ